MLQCKKKCIPVVIENYFLRSGDVVVSDNENEWQLVHIYVRSKTSWSLNQSKYLVAVYYECINGHIDLEKVQTQRYGDHYQRIKLIADVNSTGEYGRTSLSFLILARMLRISQATKP